jgi:hypothetical protein
MLTACGSTRMHVARISRRPCQALDFAVKAIQIVDQLAASFDSLLIAIDSRDDPAQQENLLGVREFEPPASVSRRQFDTR